MERVCSAQMFRKIRLKKIHKIIHRHTDVHICAATHPHHLLWRGCVVHKCFVKFAIKIFEKYIKFAGGTDLDHNQIIHMCPICPYIKHVLKKSFVKFVKKFLHKQHRHSLVPLNTPEQCTNVSKTDNIKYNTIYKSSCERP